jgi:hypothetical protein
MRGDVCSDESDEGQRCKSTLPLILILNAPVSFDSLLFFTPALPLLPFPSPIHLSSTLKKTPKKLVCQIRVCTFAFNPPPPDSPYPPIRLIINTSGSTYLELFQVTYLITILQQSLAFVMGDNATEIDLDSVIDRLLEGAFVLLPSRKIFYGYGSCRFSTSPLCWWYSVHVGSAYRGRCPR